MKIKLPLIILATLISLAIFAPNNISSKLILVSNGTSEPLDPTFPPPTPPPDPGCSDRNADPFDPLGPICGGDCPNPLHICQADGFMCVCDLMNPCKDHNDDIFNVTCGGDCEDPTQTCLTLTDINGKESCGCGAPTPTPTPVAMCGNTNTDPSGPISCGGTCENPSEVCRDIMGTCGCEDLFGDPYPETTPPLEEDDDEISEMEMPPVETEDDEDDFLDDEMPEMEIAPPM